MKNLLRICLGFSLLATSISPVAANPSQLVDMVIEKRVLGDVSSHGPSINPQAYKAQSFAMSAKSAATSTLVQQPLRGQEIHKRYEVASEAEHYQSLIRVTDLQSGELKSQISVGRRIQSLVASPSSNRLYVLCGGYFGSVWEIDTTRDVVLRKLPAFTPEFPHPPLWNPKNMVLMADGETLAIGSDKIQLVDLKSGQIAQELKLPENMVEVSSLQAHDDNSLGVGLKDANGGFSAYHLPEGSRELESGGGASAGSRHLQVEVATYQVSPPAVSRLFFIASRNNDYVRMLDRESLATVGILPLDFNVDSLALSTDRKRLFVYNRRFGQVSAIELNTRSPEVFSVIRRYRDKRFQSDHPMQLSASADSVFLWDGDSQLVAGFDSTSLYPKIGLPFGVRLNQENEKIWVSSPSHKRFNVREGKLYATYMDAAPSSLPMEIKLVSPVIDMQMSNDRRLLYVLTENTELLVMDALTHDVQQKLTLGMNPRYMSVSSNDKLLHVIDADQGSVREFKSSNLELVRDLNLDMGLNQPYQITLFDPALSQVIEVQLPRYLSDVVRVTQ